ncbi:protein SERAC1 [Marchantia polymorpha subsp. ruderalis]|uniref:DUF676 domain-containing protein n=2 Tax=Marchantia polymorpha TaxID=3197 RepID=A0A176VY22_MARPO|nr:hypothetical protein AXG93_1420s1140 [Marchantia polymorpha subsp. ruderalis]PTQ35943.1 hypothetical protein MARPO_0067s0036 [Marchantia polymorpha]BBN18091.1 hypothetical protein Mp_7g19420 [Marchantia polymorpha subsp. ruderalis]|eukprot:PTQ35943.1 hypothetical protein MARPO_0067s0036 [Marchantia polymorpha]
MVLCGCHVLYDALNFLARRVSNRFWQPAIPPDRSAHRKINDSLYMLYDFASSNGAYEDPTVDIIFFHGLQVLDYHNAYWKTWTSKAQADNGADQIDICWPEKWLGPDLGDARIFSVTYDSVLLRGRSVGKQDVLAIGDNFVADIILNASGIGPKVGQNCPVILVGHSLGGIMIKRFISSARRRKAELEEGQSRREVERFLNNVKGTFFYSTPHHGANLASWATKIPDANSEVLDLLLVLSKQTEGLNEAFRCWRQEANVGSYNICEALPTCKLGLNVGMVVEEASSRCDGDGFSKVQADHFTVCKPPSKVDNRYEALRGFIEEYAGVDETRRPDAASMLQSEAGAQSPFRARAATMSTQKRPTFKRTRKT